MLKMRIYTIDKIKIRS